MASWRDSANQEVQDDLDGLLDDSFGFACQQLDQYQEFYPYALILDTAGQRRMVAAESAAEHPQSADLIAALIETLTAQRDRLRGTAIVADVHLAEHASDAVRADLEHVQGVALSVFLPYRHRRLGRGIDYGDLQAGKAVPVIWPRESAESG